jgi:hypothetical protein
MQLVDAQFEIFDTSSSRYTCSLTRCYTPRLVKARYPFSCPSGTGDFSNEKSLTFPQSELPDKTGWLREGSAEIRFDPFQFRPLSREAPLNDKFSISESPLF